MEKGINRIQEKRLGLRLRWKAAEKWEEYVPFLILGAAALFLHYMVPGLMKDDRYYWNVLNEKGTLEYLAEGWNSWTSRMFIEAVAVWVEHLPMAVWKLLDTVIYTGIGLMISRLTVRDSQRRANAGICALMLAYPFGVDDHHNHLPVAAGGGAGCMRWPPAALGGTQALLLGVPVLCRPDPVRGQLRTDERGHDSGGGSGLGIDLEERQAKRPSARAAGFVCGLRRSRPSLPWQCAADRVGDQTGLCGLWDAEPDG